MIITQTGLANDVCESDFDSLLSQFEKSADAQQNNIKFPLSLFQPDPSAPLFSNSLPIERWLTKADVRKLNEPIYPLASLQESDSLVKKIEKSKNKVVVQVHKQDSDAYEFNFHFSRIKNCWKLTKVYDESP
jgi:hypothetical protein